MSVHVSEVAYYPYPEREIESPSRANGPILYMLSSATGSRGWFYEKWIEGLLEGKMPFPTTDEGLAQAGYTYENTSKCSGKDCGAEIAWYKTPKGKRIPLDEGTLIPHWTTCPNAKDFR